MMTNSLPFRYSPIELYWHVHHDTLVEDTSAYRGYFNQEKGIDGRIKYIKEYKDADEIKIRLRLLKPARLPSEIADAIVNRDSYNKIHDLNEYKDEILKAHAEQCMKDCPWTSLYSNNLSDPTVVLMPLNRWYYGTIFPGREEE